MKTSTLISGLLTLLCLTGVWGVFAQRRQLAELREERERLSARIADGTNQQSRSTPVIGVSRDSMEVLRLRNEVTRLGQSKQALAGVTNENLQLRAQLENARTNRAGVGSTMLPPDYVRRSQAQFKGYATPEDTIQSLLWAINNRDFTNFLQVFTPETQHDLIPQPSQPDEEFWKEAEVLPGFRVAGREQATDGSVVLQLEMAPGTPAMPMRFRSVGGQWKVDKN